MNDLTCPPPGFFCCPFYSLDLTNCYTACFGKTASTERERGRKTNTTWRVMTHRMAKLNIDWCVGYTVKGSNWAFGFGFLRFVKARIDENCTFPPAIMLQERKAISSQRREGIRTGAQQKEQVQQNKRGITQSEDTNIYRKMERKLCWSQDLCHAIIYTMSSRLQDGLQR